MNKTYWNFDIYIESEKTVYTKNILEELSQLFESSEIISHYVVKETSRNE